MKKNIYKLLSGAKQGLFALALTVFSGTAYSQATYTFNYTGSAQTLTLQAGTYEIEMWGADGGNSNNSRAGIGGYSKGDLTLPTTTALEIMVGGAPVYLSAGGLQPGGYNGGGSGYAASTGRAGGGATHIASAPGLLSALASNTAAVFIVAGGGGGDQNAGLIGHGGGLSGGGTYPGTQTGSSGSTPALAGTFGQGGNVTTSYGGGGGGGWYGGGGNQNNAGSGGSGYIGGVTNAVSTMSGTAGFVTKPVVTGNGMVIIRELCNLNITSTSSIICSGAAVTLSTNAIAGTFTWSTGNTTTSSIVVSPAVTTTYTLAGQGTNPSGCPAVAAYVVTVNNSPTVTINSSTTSACQGQSVTLTASGANTYTWNNGVTNGVAFAPSATALYTVTGANACGTATAGITVTVSSLPVTAATTSSLVCAGSPATLTAGGATTYSWLPGTGTQSAYIVNPTANTIYTVTGKTGNCQGVATITVNTNPLPTLTIATSGTAVCYGNSTNLTVSGNAVSYTWSVNGQTGLSISVGPTLTSVYTVTGTSSANCVKSVSQIIVVNPNPVININVSNPEVCSGGASTLTASGTNTYTWDGGINTASNVVNPAVTTAYNVTGTNTLTTCFTTTQVSVNVFEPEIAVSSNTTICTGANVVIGATGAISYTWANNSSTTQNILVTPTVSTTYTVSGTVVNLQSGVACPASNTIDVNVFALPAITAVSSKTAICRGTSATLTADGAGATGTYTWTNGLGNNPVITVSPILDQTYNVSATDENGCKNTATVQVLVSQCTGITAIPANNLDLLIYPNPNNGAFTISANMDVTLYIINELGQQVKEITLNAANPQVKINNLSGGVYFITGTHENGSVKQKIVITD